MVFVRICSSGPTSNATLWTASAVTAVVCESNAVDELCIYACCDVTEVGSVLSVRLQPDPSDSAQLVCMQRNHIRQ